MRPKSISVNLLDGRCNSKGESKHDTYEVKWLKFIQNMILFF